jgi:hypothetical protein
MYKLKHFKLKKFKKAPCKTPQFANVHFVPPWFLNNFLSGMRRPESGGWRPEAFILGLLEAGGWRPSNEGLRRPPTLYSPKKSCSVPQKMTFCSQEFFFHKWLIILLSIENAISEYWNLALEIFNNLIYRRKISVFIVPSFKCNNSVNTWKVFYSFVKVKSLLINSLYFILFAIHKIWFFSCIAQIIIFYTNLNFWYKKLKYEKMEISSNFKYWILNIPKIQIVLPKSKSENFKID